MAMYVGARVDQISIDPDWDDGPKRYGDIQISWPTHRFSEKELADAMAKVALAGPIAEMIYNDDPLHPATVPEWASDWKQAQTAASLIFSEPKQRQRYLESLISRLFNLLSREKNWELIATMSDELEAHERLDAEDLFELFNLEDS